jgi:hypothetical protein
MRPDPLEPVENQFQPTIRMDRAAFDAAINEFDVAPRYPVDEMRKAVSLAPALPATSIDARERNLAKQASIAIAVCRAAAECGATLLARRKTPSARRKTPSGCDPGLLIDHSYRILQIPAGPPRSPRRPNPRTPSTPRHAK